MVAGKRFNAKFTLKNWFSDRAFLPTIEYADIGCLKPLHALFDKHILYYMLVKLKQNPNYTKFSAFWQKMVHHFGQNIDYILVAETIVNA